MSSNAPPLLPPLIAASVSMRCSSLAQRPRTRSSWSFAETTPNVIVLAAPCGLPIAATAADAEVLAAAEFDRIHFFAGREHELEQGQVLVRARC